MFFRKFLFRCSIQNSLKCSLSPSSFAHHHRPFHTKYFESSLVNFGTESPCCNHLFRKKFFQSSSSIHTRIKYSTQNLFRLTETSATQLQPYLDIENVIQNQDLLQESVNKRQLSRRQVREISELFSKAQDYKARKELALKLRQENTVKVQDILKREINKEEHNEELKSLREKGRQLREQAREAENKFNEINDELVDFILSLPNVVSKDTPDDNAHLVKETSPGKRKWDEPEYTAIETNCGPGLLAEFPVGQSAWLDIDLRGKAQAHLLKGGFIETGNAEYVKRIILHGAGIDHSQFLRIREPNVKRGLEHTTYLAGGASLPSFLALFAQSIIEDPTVLPLRYFVIGRSYQSQKSKPGIYQSHVVQTFVACKSEEEMEQEVERLQCLMESFYSNVVGFSFQTQIVPAPRLQMYEKKKLAFVMKATDKSPSKMIGTISTVGDYISKRLLCCYFDEKKKTKFLHLVSAKFFDITHFLRTPNPKLVSHTDALARAKPRPGILTFEHDGTNEKEEMPRQK